MLRSTATLLLAVATAGALVACSGANTATTSRTVAPKIERRAHTGVPELDQVLDTALAPDRIEMARLTGYEKLPCVAAPDADHPQCRQEESIGSLVEVLPKLGCDKPTLIRPEDVPVIYGAALTGTNPALIAAYQPQTGVDQFGAQYIGVIATGKHDTGADQAVALHVNDGRIIGIEDDCGDALRLIDESRVASWVVRPGAAGPDTPTAVPATVTETPVASGTATP